MSAVYRYTGTDDRSSVLIPVSRETLIIIAYSDYLYGRKRLNNISSSGGRETREEEEEEGRLEGSRGGREGERRAASWSFRRDGNGILRTRLGNRSLSLIQRGDINSPCNSRAARAKVGGIYHFIGRKSKTISAKNGSKMSRDACEKKRGRKKDA